MKKSLPSTNRVLSPYYKAVYRWHFFAGLFVLPFIFLIAITGLIYLFHTELDEYINHDYYFNNNMAQQHEKPQPHHAIIAAAQTYLAGNIVNYTPAISPNRNAEVVISEVGNSHHGEGKKTSVFINPQNLAIAGVISDKKILQIVKKIHSLEYFGTFANYFMEIISGFVIILIISGIYLWLPRGLSVGVYKLSETNPKKRLFWRDFHAISGFYVGIVILFLAITGMFWSAYWGDKVNSWVNQEKIGYPPEFWQEIPQSTIPKNATKVIIPNINWGGEKIPMPESTPPKFFIKNAEVIDIDKAIAIFENLGIAKGYEVALPQDETGVYSASVFPKKVENEQVIHIDQYSGQVLFNNKYQDIGWGARIIEWSISVHQGHEYGIINQILMAIACLGLITLGITGIIAWLKRKPAHKIAAPPRQDTKATLIIWGLIMGVGILYPLTGLTMILAKIFLFFTPKNLIN